MRPELHNLLSALIDPPRTVVACAELARRVYAAHVSFAVAFPGDDEQAELANELVALVDLQLETAALVDCQYVLAPLAIALFGDNADARAFSAKIGAARERARQARTIIPEPEQTTPMNEPPAVVEDRATEASPVVAPMVRDELRDRLMLARALAPTEVQWISVSLSQDDIARILASLAK